MALNVIPLQSVVSFPSVNAGILYVFISMVSLTSQVPLDTVTHCFPAVVAL